MAALDDGLVHHALAASLHALQAGAGQPTTPTTPTSAFRKTSADSSAAAAPGRTPATPASTITPSRQSRSATNLVAFAIIVPGHLGDGMELFALRHEDSRASCSGSRSGYAAVATGLTHLIGRKLSRLFFRQQAVTRRTSASISRASANTASRSRSSKARTARSRAREKRVRGGVPHHPAHHQRAHLGFSRSPSSTCRSPSSSPTSLVAPFYYAKKVDFGRFRPIGRRLRQRQFER